jgi:chromatin assembly factor 1 subunit B
MILSNKRLCALSAIFIAPLLRICPGKSYHGRNDFNTDDWGRSNDGLTLLMTSSDGFCSILTFTPEELGQTYTSESPPSARSLQTTSLSSQNTPVPTPTSSIAPPSPFPNSSNSHHQRTLSNPPNTDFFVARPSSPTRSNSTSSIATQSSVIPLSSSNTTNVISNPTLVAGSVPSITAATSSFATTLSMTTPPETPRSTASSVSGVKRDASESEKEDIGQAQPIKKRRIAPTLVGEGKK